MNRLRLARFQKRTTQLLLFKQTGVWPSKISAIENNLMEAREDEKKKFAKALGLSKQWLFPPARKSKDGNENALRRSKR